MSTVTPLATLHFLSGGPARPATPRAMPAFAWLLLLMALVGVYACDRGATASDERATSDGAPQQADSVAKPEAVKPPFPVSGELDGLLMVWFDAEGLHTAQRRSEIPEAQREVVRIDSLNVSPEDRLDPDLVYIADLRSPSADGNFPVQKAARSWFDAQVDRAKPVPAVDDAAEGGIVVYKASWCGVCRSAAAYLRSRHVPFVEKDVEKDRGANEEMMRKAHAKGLRPHGVPVIDFQGEIMLGFDKPRLSALIDRYGKGKGKAI